MDNLPEARVIQFKRKINSLIPRELVGQDFLNFIRFLNFDGNPDRVDGRLDVAPLVLAPRYHDGIQEQLLAHSVVERLYDFIS